MTMRRATARWGAMALVGLLGSAHAAPWSPRTDDFEFSWQANYGWGTVARANEFKSSFVEVFLPDQVDPGETTIQVLRSRERFGDRVEDTAASFVAGEQAQAYAHLQPRLRNGSFPQPAGADRPASVWSQSNFLDQKVHVDTKRLVNVTAEAPVTRQGQRQIANNPPVWELTDPVTLTPDIRNQHSAYAKSSWSDSWTFDKATTVTLSFKVHAHTGVHLGPGTPGWTELANHMYGQEGDNFTVLNNTQMASTGITASDRPRDRFGRDLSASMQIFDTTHLRDQTPICDEFGDCYWPQDPTYCPEDREMYNCGRAVAGAGFNTVRFADSDQQAWWESGFSAQIESMITLSFDVEAGREYLIASFFGAEAINGGWIDGSNTMRLLDIRLGNDATLSSRAAEAFGLLLPITRGGDVIPGGTVPEPSTLALLLAAGGLTLLRRRGRTAR